jgi:hypothetical protein
MCTISASISPHICSLTFCLEVESCGWQMVWSIREQFLMVFTDHLPTFWHQLLNSFLLRIYFCTFGKKGSLGGVAQVVECLPLQVRSPEFKLQSHQKNQKLKSSLMFHRECGLGGMMSEVRERQVGNREKKLR